MNPSIDFLSIFLLIYHLPTYLPIYLPTYLAACMHLQALSRLNVFERGLAFINQNIMQDRWSRNALLLYLLLVHAFALLYAWEVLNPQLIDEVNAHLKAKWSAETFSMQEHPDI